MTIAYRIRLEPETLAELRRVAHRLSLTGGHEVTWGDIVRSLVERELKRGDWPDAQK